MSSIYNHKQLQPQGAPNPGPGPSGSVANGQTRLNDCFDTIRQEFEALAQDASLIRNQKEEADAGLSAQINELNTIRHSVYELETKHHAVCKQYEEEIRLLRAELTNVRAQQPPPPSASTSGPPQPAGSYSDPYYNRGRDGPDRERERDRDRDRERDRADRDRDRERDQRDPKRVKAERIKERPDHFSPSLSHPPPGSAKLPPALPPPGIAPYAPSVPAPPAEPSSALISGPGLPAALMSGPPGINSQAPTPFPDDLDPHSVPPELKKEGSDWFAVFNPKVKRVLDVSLVHTLVHASVVCCVRFSADGKYLATGCNQTAQIYDTKTGAKTCVLVDETADNSGDLYIRSVCFSPDGKLLATGAEDKTIRIWDIAKKRIRNTFTGHTQEIYSLAFSGDGRLIVSGSGDRTTRIWDMADGSLSKTLAITDLPENVDAGVTSVAISSDGRLVAAGSLDTVVRIWDARTGELLERLRGHRDSVYSVAFTPDAKGLVSGSLDKTLKYWDVGRLGTGIPRPNSPNSASSSSKRDTINGTRKDVANTDSNSACTMNFTGHKDYVLSVAVSHDGQWVVSGSKDRGVQFWDARTATVQLMLQGHKNSVISIDLSPAGSILATGSGDWQARIWSYNTV